MQTWPLDFAEGDGNISPGSWLELDKRQLGDLERTVSWFTHEPNWVYGDHCTITIVRLVRLVRLVFVCQLTTRRQHLVRI